MSDEFTADSAKPKPSNAGVPSGEHRLDAAHETPGSKLTTAPSSKPSATPVGTSAVAQQQAGSASVAPVEEPRSNRETAQERVLLQASQIAEHLSTQYAELDRREQRLNGQLAQLDQERRNVRLWVSQFEDEAEERDARLQRQEADCTERLQQCAKLEHELEQKRQEVVRAEGELTANREEQTAELQREKALLNNRIRFQEEHLKKSRRELEQKQNEFRLEQQQATQSRYQGMEALRLQRTQLNRYRDLLDQRELSLLREREVIRKTRHVIEDEHESAREKLLNEKQEWNRQRETQQSEMRRQQNMLKLHAENLESRRLRLDRLRAELEDTHRKTLEMRLAVEEAWAQLAQSTGPDVAKQRVDEAQSELSEHYQQTREDLVQHRQELERAQLQFQKQRDEFREERQALAEWVTERTEQLQQRERAVDETEQALADREQAWRQKEQAWNSERAEAETVIRDLLKQLADLTGDSTPAPQDESSSAE